MREVVVKAAGVVMVLGVGTWTTLALLQLGRFLAARWDGGPVGDLAMAGAVVCFVAMCGAVLATVAVPRAIIDADFGEQ